MTTMSRTTGSLNFDTADVAGTELRGNIIIIDSTHFRISYGGGDFDDFLGTGFVYTNGKPTAGTISGFGETLNGVTIFSVGNLAGSGVTLTIPQMLAFIDTHDTAGFVRQILAGDDTITGTGQADVIRAQTGNDLITGGGGNDMLDGGAGIDTAIYSGPSTQYAVTLNADGSVKVVDSRAGSPDGTDTLFSIENIRFSDTTVAAPAVAPAQATAIAFANILHQAASSATGADLSAKVAAGTLTQSQAVAQMVSLAVNTTSVATLAYEFFTGKVPTAAGYDYLVSPTGPNANNLNSNYYQSFNVENRYINFAVNLGKFGEGNAQFTAAYGALTLAQATKQAYAQIFGGTPTDAKVSALLDPVISFSGGTMTRAQYFAYYGQDGANGIGTKAAMVGWLMGEAVKADIGMYAKANDAFLADLSDGAVHNVPLVGVYGSSAYAFGG